MTMSPRKLAEWTQDARERTFEAVSDLDDGQMLGPHLPITNPLLWEIGHMAWFQEKWVLRHAGGRPALRADADALYDSMAIPHDMRWDLPLPPREETYAYMREVRDRVLGRLAEERSSLEELYHVLYSLHHEDMHTEAFTYMRQTLGYPPPRFSAAGGARAEAGGGPCPGDARVPGGTYLLGSSRDEPFVFDNEKWAHPVEVAPFAIARAPVTQAEFARFAADGGYRRRELWSDAGWAWRERQGAFHPVYWRRAAGGGWQRRDFDRWVPLEPHRPVIHVSWHEAEAYCRWAGRRLPAEAEWELAATGEPAPDGGFSPRKRRYPWGDEPPAPERARLDWRGMGCAEVGAHAGGDSAFGCRQMLGNVWEWTSSDFLPFPGFAPDPYKEYSEPWFRTRKVLRGGCWATRSRLIRANYRNYFTPDRRDVFAGFRTCAL
ncbi:MAG: ergothioneine biosynthesis protein EgtB [Candidatus Tectomicrobia bacterium]|nr:ergothioneine biosynthesis protein EgtB [Candidatus Tectomicrobia bacterium]